MNLPLQIGKHRLDSRVLVAPMSGITDLPFRRILQDFQPGLVVSEMVASEGFSRGKGEGAVRSAGVGDIFPLVIQLVGRDPYWMGEGAKHAQAAGADIIDINMGCPARKVVGGQSGSALMREPELAMEIIAAVLASTSKPVTLKMRLGWNDDNLNAADIGQQAEALGVCMLTVHGRTRCQFYEGVADWKAVGNTVRAVDIPVIVNGDINSAEDARCALKQSGAAGVMVGRGLVGRPWALRGIIAAVDGERLAPAPLSSDDMAATATRHYQLMLDFYGEGKGLRMARKHVAGYIEHAPGLSPEQRLDMRAALCRTVDTKAVLEGLRAVFMGPKPLAEITVRRAHDARTP